MTKTSDDGQLARNAAKALSTSMEAQFLASLLEYLRDHPRPWWSGTAMRERWPTEERFRWFEGRPDLRAKVTHELTGLALGAARAGEPAFQAELIERVLDSGDVSFDAWESAFDPKDLALYGPKAVLWSSFRGQFPWESPEAEDKAMLVWLLGRLLEETKGSSIMTPLYVRSAIDVRVWQEQIPLEIRVQVDGRRLRRELEGKPFTCSDELEIVRIDRMVECIPLEHIRRVLDALERVLQGLTDETATHRDASAGVDEDDDHDSTETAVKEGKRGRAQA